eukprot:CAMPEP_0114497232 /NCGR_PEP_ID=MMETSP0109-20121206/6209_1 /TAXON_ID=29199 /ORGANISM="Chlorarachnion reptans, Strain CCCM449" /LENGTH=258 /DNA_ID=CAMNT_0001674589 /DNA_START=11 /DNA_END=787 /DNA_ORIENTATION=+
MTTPLLSLTLTLLASSLPPLLLATAAPPRVGFAPRALKAMTRTAASGRSAPVLRPRSAEPSAEEPVRQAEMSRAVPFLKRPDGLNTRKLAGDYGFDPLGLAKDRESLTQYRLAEIKHGRLAMLAAAAWPLQELENPMLAEKLNLPNLVEETGGRSPSVLNGGLEQVSAAYWTAVVLLTVVIETIGNERWGGKVAPGDYGFDPLNLMPKDPEGAAQMMEKEIKHGRVAMMAILAFVLQEFIGHSPIVEQTPFFFKPLFS